MKRLALVLTLAGSLAATAVAATPRKLNLLQTFGGRLTQVKQLTTLPILLPRTMPLGGTYRLYASGNATRHSYALSLAAAPNCRGANACFVAEFDGERGGKPLPGKFNVRSPPLARDPAPTNSGRLRGVVLTRVVLVHTRRRSLQRSGEGPPEGRPGDPDPDGQPGDRRRAALT
jgi:hypothetical protein